MKKLIALTILLISLIGCTKDENTTDDLITENEDYYNCTNFFTSGNYTSFCTIDTEIVNISDTIIDGGDTICTYIIPPLNADLEESTGVSFLSLQTTPQAQEYFNNRKTESETSAADNPKLFLTEVSINNHEGYVLEGQFANYSKSLVVRYKNVIVSAAVIYYKDWYPVAPCNYETSELTELMSSVLENLQTQL